MWLRFYPRVKSTQLQVEFVFTKIALYSREESPKINFFLVFLLLIFLFRSCYRR